MDYNMQNHMLRQIVGNIEKVIIGKREPIELVLCALLCRGHVLVEDVPGVGKTSLVSALARSLSCSFKRIQFTPDILPSDITGFSLFNQKTGEFEYRPGAVMSQIVLADEINRTSPKTQSSLLEVMEENQVTVDGNTYAVPQPFIVLATQNPVEYLGTYPLPEAQLDRFFIRVSIGYPSQADEVKMLSRFQGKNQLTSLKPVVTAEQIMLIQDTVSNIFVDRVISDYIVKIVIKTRENENVVLGGSPRSSICLLKAAQAWAFYNERDYVQPDDVKKMAVPVMEHRIVLKQEAKLKKITAMDIIETAIMTVKTPL